MTPPHQDDAVLLPSGISARGLVKSYQDEGDEVRAVDHVDLDITTGTFAAIMGPSGCGKSTLLHILGGLARPTAGRVLVDGDDLATMSDNDLAEVRRNRIGFVFQAFNLVPVLTVEENVALPATIAGRNRRWTHERVDELLDAVGLQHRRSKRPSQLSGGEQQRAAIARALILQPAVILADEPTGNLDSTSGTQIVRLLIDLHRGGQTIILVTHDVKIAGVTDRILVMRDGRLHEPARDPEQANAGPLIARLLDPD